MNSICLKMPFVIILLGCAASQTLASEKSVPAQMTLQEQLCASTPGDISHRKESHCDKDLRLFAPGEDETFDGEPLSENDILDLMSDRTMLLDYFISDQPHGDSNSIEMTIKVDPEGRAKIGLIHTYYQSNIDEYPSTHDEHGVGHWWVEGKSWCLQSTVVDDNAKDCYQLTKKEDVLTLRYSSCGNRVSHVCKVGRRAAVGVVQ